MAIVNTAPGIAGERFMPVSETLLYALISVVGIKLIPALPLWTMRPAGAPGMRAEGGKPRHALPICYNPTLVGSETGPVAI
jgi:hypothetical protein